MTKEQVLEEFDKGYDCCQVVFRYWAEKLNMDTELAYKVSSGFGAGMFQGETCGAVIGAYMALGLKYGSTLPSPEGDEQRVESIIKDVEFREKFLQKYNSIYHKLYKHTDKLYLCQVLHCEATKICFEYYFLLHCRLYTMKCNYYYHSNFRLKIRIQDS